jgi:hypothetical protein
VRLCGCVRWGWGGGTGVGVSKLKIEKFSFTIANISMYYTCWVEVIYLYCTSTVRKIFFKSVNMANSNWTKCTTKALGCFVVL